VAKSFAVRLTGVCFVPTVSILVNQGEGLPEANRMKPDFNPVSSYFNSILNVLFCYIVHDVKTRSAAGSHRSHHWRTARPNLLH
jgi:hypothetical protein